MAKREEIIVSAEELEKQKKIASEIRELNLKSGVEKTACVVTYGCQQNENDSERLKGMLASMGYRLTEDRENANVILFNTCAVRDNAEQKLKGNVGALKFLKTKKKKNVIIGVQIQITVLALRGSGGFRARQPCCTVSTVLSVLTVLPVLTAHKRE